MKVKMTFLMIAALMLSAAANAGAVEIKGTATVPYDSFFTSTPSDSVKHEAIEKGKLNAWREFTSTFSMAKQKAYLNLESEFIKNLDDYIVEYDVVADKVDKSTKTFSVVVRVKINESKVDSMLSSASAAGSAASGAGSGFGFIFVAREAGEVKSFDERRTKITKGESSSANNESAAIRGGTMISSETAQSYKKEQQGGNTVRKADQISYLVTSPQDINAAMNEILTPAGFEVIDYTDIATECGGAAPETVKSEFSSNYELTQQTRKSAIDAARKCQILYFALGTLDIGLQDTDPVTGLKRINVTVNAQVWNIGKALPRLVASVNSNPYAGLGPDQVVARRNAIKEAAASAAKAIVDQLNAKGLL